MKTRSSIPIGVLVLALSLLPLLGCSTDDGPPVDSTDASVVGPDSGGDIAFPTDVTDPNDGAGDTGTDDSDDTGTPDSADTTEDSGSPDEGRDGDAPTEDQAGGSPTVEILSPHEGDEINGDVTITISATDDEQVERVTLDIDGDEVAELMDAPYEWVWDTSALDFGSHTIEATAFDGDDNTGTDSVAVEVICAGDRDCPPHEVTIVGPTADATVCGVYIISVVAEDDVGVEEVEFFVDGASLSTDDDEPFEAEWDTTLEDDGEHEIEVAATDIEGQEARAVVAVTVDNSGDECNNPPSIAIIAPKPDDYVSGDVSIEVATSDDIGVASVQFFIDRGSLLVDEAVPFEAEWRTHEFSEGTHAIAALATDTGGETARDEISVTVDRTPPELEIISPESNEVFENTVDFSVTASDNIRLRDVSFAIDRGVPVVLEEGPFALSIPDVPSGSHRFGVVATDAAGLTTERAIIFHVDRRPTVAFLAPDDADLITGPITVRVEAEDDLSTPTVRLFDNDDFYGTFNASGHIWWVPARERIAHTLRAVAIDGRNQEGETEINVLVDYPFSIQVQRCNGLLCEIIEGVISVTGTVNFEVTGVDDAGELAEVELLVGGDSVATEMSAPFTFEWDSSTVDDGEWPLLFAATNSLGEEASVEITAIVRNCFCNRNEGVCDAAENNSNDPCECDADCDGTTPCGEDAFCDGYCPAGSDPDCGACDGIPVEPNQGLPCFEPMMLCTTGRCVGTGTIPFEFGVCHQLCSPGNCEEICGEGAPCNQQYTDTGEAERFDDGRFLGLCGVTVSPTPQPYDRCDTAGQCRDGDQCIQVTAPTSGQCMPVCTVFDPSCPEREGYLGECAYVVGGTDTNVCGISCDPDELFGLCPSGMVCTRISEPGEDTAAICHWP